MFKKEKNTFNNAMNCRDLLFQQMDITIIVSYIKEIL